jgi:hypothetical protein
MHLTAMLVRLQRLDGNTLVDESLAWRRNAITAVAHTQECAGGRVFSAFMLSAEAA